MIIIHNSLLCEIIRLLRRPVQAAAAPPRRATNSRRLTAFPKSGITPNFDFQLSYQNRKVRAAKWGSKKILRRRATSIQNTVMDENRGIVDLPGLGRLQRTYMLSASSETAPMPKTRTTTAIGS